MHHHVPLVFSLVPMAGWFFGTLSCRHVAVEAFVPFSTSSTSHTAFPSSPPTSVKTSRTSTSSSSRLFVWNGARTTNQAANDENNNRPNNNHRPDLYQILGVRRDAQMAEIKAAYRQMAKKYHPDANKATDTTEIFKEINRAYQTLSDPDARKNYNIYGVENREQAPEATVDDPYASGGFSEDVSMDDIWESFYGKNQRAAAESKAPGSWTTSPNTQWWDSHNNANPNAQAQDGADPTNGNNRKHGFRSGPVIGDDVRMDIEIDFSTAINGGQHILEIQHYQSCTTCQGKGEGSAVITCPHCGGKGSTLKNHDVATVFQREEAKCRHCNGTGKQQFDHCPPCEGEGRVMQTKQVKVTIPAGVEDGSRLLVCGEGHVGPRGGPPGDLYLYLKVKLQEGFKREGADIHSTASITFVDAILGSTITSKTVNGDVAIDIPAGTQPGHVIRIKGMGAPRSMNQPGVRGDHFITIHVEIPTELTPEQEQMMQQMKTGDVSGFTAATAAAATDSDAAKNLHEAQLAAEKEAREEAMEQYTRLKVEFDAQKAEAERINKAWKDESETFSRLLRETRAELAANHESAEANMSVLLNQIAELQSTNARLSKELESSADSTVGKQLYQQESAARERAEREMQLLRQRLQESDRQAHAMQQTLKDTKRHFETQLNNALSHKQSQNTSQQAQNSLEQQRFEQMKKNYEAMAANHQAMESERETFKKAVEDLEKQLQIARDNINIRHANEEAAKETAKQLQEELEALKAQVGGEAALEAERIARESAEKEIKRLQAELTYLHEQAEIEKQIQPKEEGPLAAPVEGEAKELLGVVPSGMEEVEQLKKALSVALEELENTRKVLREAIARVDASDLRSGKLEQELVTLKADLQVVASMMEEMRTTSQFTKQSSPYYAQFANGQVDGRPIEYRNGQSNGSHVPANGYHSNGYTNGENTNGNTRGGWRPFGFPSNGRHRM